MDSQLLTCPKCGGDMRSYERNGIQIEQCADCRGVFLDRGELDRMLDAEARYSEAPPTTRPATPWELVAPRGGHDRYYHDDDDRRAHDRSRHGRRRGWLGELFDD